MTNKQTDEVIKKYIKAWIGQGRAEGEVFAVRNFMTGQGLIMVEMIAIEAKIEAMKELKESFETK